jgi:hypothetical protein
MDSDPPAWERRLVHPSAASAATVVLLIVAVAFVVASSPPPPQTRLEFGMDAGPGKDAGPARRAQGAEGAVAGEHARRPAPQPVAPRAVITRYYLDLDRRRFAEAWRILSPAVRAGFGTFESWRAGYATTLRSRPRALRITGHDGGATAVLVLEAADRAPCGTLRRSFDVRWELRRAGRGWRAERLSAMERPGAGPAGCAPRHDGAGGGR